ncbi:lipoxygenase family protein [Chitinimonas lacunae]|uniref:Lipoxygenase family protein n=1 Tax=Chitinimonas lacunae TaxID=1963018 RepID=A0ABV8MPF7_9NEIS
MFDLFPRRHPTLPQQDTPKEREQREQQLDSARLTYCWTDDMPNVVGVPMATEVPYADTPTLVWLAEVGETGLAILENLLAAKLAASPASAELGALGQKLENLRAIVQPLHADLKTTMADEGTRLLSGLGSAAFHLVTQHQQALQEVLDQMLDLAQALMAKPAQLASSGSDPLEPYQALFKTLPRPSISYDFMTDEEFAHLRVAGPNPMLLSGVQSLPAKFPLSDAQYQQVMGKGDSLAAALQDHRLYLLDYAELDSLVANPGQTNGQPKAVYAPIALFAVPRGGSELVPVAIQNGQNPAINPIFLRVSDPSQPDYWGWQMAKTVVQVAEGNYHELFVHLARTHLVMEAFCVATHRNLAQTHPINVLLLPHFEGSLFINKSAADSLIAPGGPIDHIFGATITATQQAAGNDRLAFDFYAKRLPQDLQARGVDNPNYLPDYPYRDDGLLVWQAIAKWTESYVDVYYQSNTDILNDTELAAWTADLIGNGKIKGFTPINTKAQLSDVLTMVIYTASAQHAAVNFPQKPDMTYAPAISGAGWSSAPNKESGQSQSAWLKLLPPVDEAQEQLNVLYLLGSVHYRQLGEYRTNTFPYLPWFEDPRITKPGGPLDMFRMNLQGVEETIQARNKTRKQVYEFLLPSLIPPSVNI